MESVREAIRRWWEGRFVPYETKQDPGGPYTIVIGGHQDRHWTAKAARAVVAHLRRNWQFWIATAVAVATAIVAI